MTTSRAHKIGIVGGSFNPPHTGHLTIGLMALDYGLDEVWYTVAGAASVGKELGDYAPLTDRIALVRLLLAGHRALKLAPVHGGLGTESAVKIAIRFPHERFFMVMGGDCLGSVPRYPPEDQDALRRFPLIIIRRPGMDEGLLERAPLILRRDEVTDPRAFLSSGAGYVCIGSYSNTSSSALRRDIDVLEWLSAPVPARDNVRAMLDYINANNLYQGSAHE